jgi:hypothetical protein
MEVRAGGVLGLDSLRGIISLHEMQPIELTKEFFTRNGFIEQVDCDEYGTYFRSVDLRTEVFETSGGWSVHIDDDHFMSVFRNGQQLPLFRNKLNVRKKQSSFASSHGEVAVP